MKEEPIDSIPLDNGLTLQLFNLSRPVAADRWYVGVAGEVTVFPHPALLDEAPEDVMSVVGDRVVFRQKSERHFIDEGAMEDVKKAMIQSLTATLIPYLSHPDFARRLVRKTYRDNLQRRNRQQP